MTDKLACIAKAAESLVGYLLSTYIIAASCFNFVSHYTIFNLRITITQFGKHYTVNQHRIHSPRRIAFINFRTYLRAGTENL